MSGCPVCGRDMHAPIETLLMAVRLERDALKVKLEDMEQRAKHAERLAEGFRQDYAASNEKRDALEARCETLEGLLMKNRDAFLRAGTCKDDPICDPKAKCYQPLLASACRICHEQVAAIDAALNEGKK